MFFVNGDNGQRDVEEEDAEANQRKRISDDRLHQIGLERSASCSMVATLLWISPPPPSSFLLPYLFLYPLKPIPSPCSPLSVSSPSNNRLRFLARTKALWEVLVDLKTKIQMPIREAASVYLAWEICLSLIGWKRGGWKLYHPVFSGLGRMGS